MELAMGLSCLAIPTIILYILVFGFVKRERPVHWRNEYE